MMRSFDTGLRWGMAILSALAAHLAHASFHLYSIDQIFSDASGNVQYVQLFDSTPSPFGDGQEFLTGHQLVASRGSSSKMYTFPSDLPATIMHPTGNTKFLVATQGFADLNIVTPDYIIPNGFLFIPGGMINYVLVGQVAYTALPTDGMHAIDRNGIIVVASPTNFAGNTAAVNVPPPTPKGVYDIDANGVVDALTDGVLLLRYLLGLHGDQLITGAIGPNAARNTAAAIEAHIASNIIP